MLSLDARLPRFGLASESLTCAADDLILAGDELSERIGMAALGGGGVELLVSDCSAPAFLLTHRFNSGSYTKEEASPNLARIGLLGAEFLSWFLAPTPSQLIRLHPLFAGIGSLSPCASRLSD